MSNHQIVDSMLDHSSRILRASYYNTMRKVGYRLGITVLLTIFLFHIHLIGPESIFPPGADGWYMARMVEMRTWAFYYRSILTVFIHNGMYTLLHPLGVDGLNAIGWSSSLAGAFALQALYTMRRDPVFLALNVLSGSFIVFVGHVENYAWVNLFLLWYFLWIQKYLENQAPVRWAATFFFLACLSHMLAVFYAPSLAYVCWKKKPDRPYEVLIPLLTFLFLILFLSLGFTMLGTDNGLERLVPWFHKWAPNQFFTFFSLSHIQILFYFHRCAAFWGIPMELPLLWFMRKQINTLYLRFLMVCVFCGLFWTTIWHPDWGYNDWDLFGQFAIPLHVLLGYLLSRKIFHHEIASQ